MFEFSVFICRRKLSSPVVLISTLENQNGRVN